MLFRSSKSDDFLKGIEVYEIEGTEFNCSDNVVEEEMFNKDLIKVIIDLCMEVENGSAEDKKQRQWTIKDIVKEYYQ